ncbi:MAG: hypothetical protein IPI34_02600 [bacterium]|nr:hypothetical protein [bacterium]
MHSTRWTIPVLVALPLVSLICGCSGRDQLSELDEARARIEPRVFDEGYYDDVYFQAFSGTHYAATSQDSIYAFSGATSLKVTVPPQNSALGAYAGGVLTSAGARDLADYNALTFYVRSSVNSTLNEAGFGNDNTGTSRYSAGRLNIPLTGDWQFVVIPIPSPSKLIAERGLFTFAEGWEAANPRGHEVWFDDIRFAALGNITDPRPFMPSGTKQYFIGSTVSLEGTRTTFDVDGADVVVGHMPGYFDYHSSDPAVAEVTGGGVRIVGEGEATLTATMGGVEVAGTLTLGGFVPPQIAAPVPAVPAGDVIALYSDVYQPVTVDSWNTHWTYSTTQDEIYAIGGDQTRMYTTLNFVGIQFATQTIDATNMTHLHLDVYAPVGTVFKVKLVAFNADNGYMIGQAELTFGAETTPAFVSGGWSSLEIPLADFPLPAPRDHLGQLVLSTTDAPLVLVDNIYLHR